VKGYRGANTDQLFALLENPHFSAYRDNILWTIGAVANESAARRLADYLSSTTPLNNGSSQGEYIRLREYGLLGLTLALKDQPMPWLNDYLIAHADPEQWMKNLESVGIDRDTATMLARRSIVVISRMGYGEPLAMQQEIRARRLAKLPISRLCKVLPQLNQTKSLSLSIR
jgi:hypothetical protein